jgi:hypothetical protein
MLRISAAASVAVEPPPRGRSHRARASATDTGDSHAVELSAGRAAACTWRADAADREGGCCSPRVHGAGPSLTLVGQQLRDARLQRTTEVGLFRILYRKIEALEPRQSIAIGYGEGASSPTSAAFDGGGGGDGWPHTESPSSAAFDGCGAGQNGAGSAAVVTAATSDARGWAVDTATRDSAAADKAANSDALESAGVGVGAAVAAAPAPVASATAAAAAGTQTVLWPPVVQCCRWQAGLQ